MKKKDVENRPRIVLVSRCVVMKGKKFLLILRAMYRDQYAAGLWEFPGGKLDEGQDIRNAEEREVLEETGIFTVSISANAFVESYIIGKGKFIGLPYVLLISIGRYIGGEVKLSAEHDAWRWVTKEEALKMKLKDDIRKAIITLF